MPSLNIIVAVAEGARLYAALEAAMAAAALGRPVRVFLQGEAAALLRDPISFVGDEARRAVGQPDLAWLVGAAFAPLVALGLATSFGIIFIGGYLISGAICTLAALTLTRALDQQ